jgi:hypothetical protein
MRTASATEAKQNPGAWLDSAQRESSVVGRQKRDIAVIRRVHARGCPSR